MIKIVSITMFFILLSGCASKNLNQTNVKNLKDVSYSVDKEGKLNLHKTYKFEDNSTKQEKQSVVEDRKKSYEVVPNFEKKYDSSISVKSKKVQKEKKIIVKGEEVKISVESIPLGEFIDFVFSSVLYLNYTVDDSVKQMKTPITLNMTNLQDRQEVFDVVKKLLSINGVDVKKENGTLFISKQSTKQLNESADNIYIGYGRKVKSTVPDDEEILMFVSYEHLKPIRAAQILTIAGLTTINYTYPSQNVQMLKSTAGEIRRALDIINLIDRPYMEGKTPYLLNFNNIDVTTFLERIKTILETNGIEIASSPEDKGILLSPIPELNSLFVVTGKRSWFEMLLYWKKKLDTKSEVSVDPRFYTYKVEHRKADELAEALNSVVDLKLETNRSSKENNSSIRTNHSLKYDLATNTLMMQMLPSEYRALLPLIEQLDALPLQVLVEVTIAEVTLTDTFSLGFEYALRNGALGDLSPIPNALLSSSIGAAGFSAVYNSQNLDATVNAYAENKLLDIMSQPRLLILNNETGNINVGTQIPIITSENSAADLSGSTDSSILRNITYRNTGVIVGLTPTINSNGVLTMSVDLSLSEAQVNDTSDIDSPLIVNRSLTTTLTLKHGETILLGGLISKNKSSTDKGVPYLMDIPWLGNFFKSQSDTTVKTELIMLIRPYIIEKSDQMREKTKKFHSILKVLKLNSQI